MSIADVVRRGYRDDIAGVVWRGYGATGSQGSGGKGKGGNTPGPGPGPKKPLRTSLVKGWQWRKTWF